MSLVGSSELWGDQAVARLCQIVVDANDAMGQQVSENRTDLLDLLSVSELEKGDDLGLSVAFLCVHYDRPDILKYLKRRGVNLAKPCDPMGFGTPMFYAVYMGKANLIEVINNAGCSVNSPCETYFAFSPKHYAKKADDHFCLQTIIDIQAREKRTNLLFHKNILKLICLRKYKRIMKFIITIQRMMRGTAMRRLVKQIRSGEVVFEQGSSVLDSSSAYTPMGDELSAAPEASIGSQQTSRSNRIKRKNKHE